MIFCFCTKRKLSYFATSLKTEVQKLEEKLYMHVQIIALQVRCIETKYTQVKQNFENFLPLRIRVRLTDAYIAIRNQIQLTFSWRTEHTFNVNCSMLVCS